DLAVIGTLDFFPPIVDDPRTFGEIAAANALSDVFAMGGRVLFALSVAAIPEDMPTPAFRAILDGAASKVREAGGILAGGHTIRDPEPKYGLAVIGVAAPERLLRTGGAEPRDVLARAGVETGGAAHNRRFVASSLTVAESVPEDAVTLAHDPQTSGGLLAAIPPAAAPAILDGLRAAGVGAWTIGRVETASSPGV